MKMFRVAALAVLIALASIQAQAQTIEVSEVDLFGQTGLDVAKLRSALTIHAGDSIPFSQMGARHDELFASVRKAIGKAPTDLQITGFDVHGKYMIFLGVPGPTVRPVRFRHFIGKNIALPGSGGLLYKKFMARLMNIGPGNGTEEDDSKGYPLFKDPEIHVIQLKMRTYALAHQVPLRDVALNSSSSEQRRAAVWLLGYLNHSKSQVAALARCMADPDGEVRNNAVRTISVIVRTDPMLARSVDPVPVVDLLRSGSWTDRNKSSNLLYSMTDGRNSALLALIRARALPALVEMAHWSNPPHAFAARVILGRVAGIPEKRLQEMIARGDIEAITDSLAR